MSKTKRSMPPAQKSLLGILIVLVLVLSYFQFVDKPIRSETEDAQLVSEQSMQEIELSTLKLNKLREIEQEMNRNAESGVRYMPSYNHIKQEISALDAILKSTKEYSISLEDPVLDVNMVRRAATISFAAGSYAKAMETIRKISNCGIRNTISVIKCSNAAEGEAASIILNMVFYETMTDGQQDSGLIVPKTENTEEESSE